MATETEKRRMSAHCSCRLGLSGRASGLVAPPGADLPSLADGARAALGEDVDGRGVDG
jgi:hypothetical protein